MKKKLIKFERLEIMILDLTLIFLVFRIFSLEFKL